MKKTITFIYPQMIMGGAEKVLVRLIENLDRKKYKINVILFKHGGELEHSFPDDVSVDYADIISIKSCFTSFKFVLLIKQLFYRIRIRMAKSYEEVSYWTLKACKIPKTISNECVICFSHYNFMSICLAAQSKAKHKILWVHCPFRENRNQKLYEKMLKEFDGAFCVSKTAKDNFDTCFPKYSNISQVVYNLIDKEEIITKSLQDTDEEIKHPAILTVGRIDDQKGHDFIPGIMRRLLNENYDVYWYLVGEGKYHDLIENQIKENNLQERLFLLGNKMNPYPYIRQCDLYVQPSRYEGWGLTVQEAKILSKPIVASNIEPFCEQLENNKTAIISDIDEESFYLSIKYLLDNPNKREEFTKNLKDVQIDNEVELNKIYSFIQK